MFTFISYILPVWDKSTGCLCLLLILEDVRLLSQAPKMAAWRHGDRGFLLLMLHLWLISANLFPIQCLTALGLMQGPQYTRRHTHLRMHKHCQWVLTQSRCWQLCSKWKQGSRPTTWTTLPIKWYVYNNTFLRLWRHTHMCACMHKDSPYTHVHTACKCILKAREMN